MAPPLLLLLAAVPPPLLLLALSHYLAAPRPVRVPIASRHVFITGGSSGIGLALARAAAAAGARVSILARDATKLERARDELRRATGAEVTTYSADVRNAEAVRRAVEAAGDIDVLVCNQGVFLPGELDEVDMDLVKFTVDVNLMGTFHLIKAALPAMRKGDGKPRSIALMSSQGGQVGFYGHAPYCASKFGLRGLGEALQQEVINDNIHISIIYPPDTETPGAAEEIKTRPEITDIISRSSGGMKAEEVAKKTLDGIMSGAFTITCNLEGLMLTMASSGMSPQRSYVMAFFEILTAGFMRFIALFFIKGWYNAIARVKAKQKKI